MLKQINFIKTLLCKSSRGFAPVFLVIAIALLAIPVTAVLVRQQQDVRQRASENVTSRTTISVGIRPISLSQQVNFKVCAYNSNNSLIGCDQKDLTPVTPGGPDYIAYFVIEQDNPSFLNGEVATVRIENTIIYPGSPFPAISTLGTVQVTYGSVNDFSYTVAFPDVLPTVAPTLRPTATTPTSVEVRIHPYSIFSPITYKICVYTFTEVLMGCDEHLLSPVSQGPGQPDYIQFYEINHDYSSSLNGQSVNVRIEAIAIGSQIGGTNTQTLSTPQITYGTTNTFTFEIAFPDMASVTPALSLTPTTTITSTPTYTPTSTPSITSCPPNRIQCGNICCQLNESCGGANSNGTPQCYVPQSQCMDDRGPCGGGNCPGNQNLYIRTCTHVNAPNTVEFGCTNYSTPEISYNYCPNGNQCLGATNRPTYCPCTQSSQCQINSCDNGMCMVVGTTPSDPGCMSIEDCPLGYTCIGVIPAPDGSAGTPGTCMAVNNTPGGPIPTARPSGSSSYFCDFNGDNIVNDADYAIWVNEMTGVSTKNSDCNKDGEKDIYDYNLWFEQKGMTR